MPWNFVDRLNCCIVNQKRYPSKINWGETSNKTWSRNNKKQKLNLNAWSVNKYLSLTSVTDQAIKWHLVGETLNFMILYYIVVSGIITKIEYTWMKTTFSMDKISNVKNHLNYFTQYLPSRLKTRNTFSYLIFVTLKNSFFRVTAGGKQWFQKLNWVCFWYDFGYVLHLMSYILTS